MPKHTDVGFFPQSLSGLQDSSAATPRRPTLYTMLSGCKTTELQVTAGKLTAAIVIMAAILPLVGEALLGTGASAGATALSSAVAPAMSSAATSSAAMAGEIGGANWMNMSSNLVRSLIKDPSTQQWMAQGENLAMNFGPKGNGIVEAVNPSVRIPGSVPELPYTNTNFGPTTVGNESRWQAVHDHDALPPEYLQDQPSLQPDVTPLTVEPTSDPGQNLLTKTKEVGSKLQQYDQTNVKPIVYNTTARIPALSSRNYSVAQVRHF